MNGHQRTGTIVVCCCLALCLTVCFLTFLQQTGASKSSPGWVIPSLVPKHVSDDPDVPFNVSVHESNVGR